VLNTQNSPIDQPVRRKKSGLFRSLLFLIVICGVVALIPSFLFPWSYYLGGHFHWLPYWQGWGRVHVESAGGDYVLYVQMEPTTRGSRVIRSSNLTGRAVLCTPTRERFKMRLGGTMPLRLNLITTGEPIHLYMSNSLSFSSQFSGDHRPYLNFYGTWADRSIELDDHRTLSTTFQKDGKLYLGHDQTRPAGKETANLVLREGSYREFEAACAQVTK